MLKTAVYLPIKHKKLYNTILIERIDLKPRALPQVMKDEIYMYIYITLKISTGCSIYMKHNENSLS